MAKPLNTLDVASVVRACAWRDAAIADGWAARPTYSSEPMERAASLTREGFKVQIITRVPMEGDKYPTLDGSILVWGPDGLSIKARGDYDFEKLTAGLRTCGACKRGDVETERVGFAGRVCAECLPAARQRVETPGWNN